MDSRPPTETHPLEAMPGLQRRRFLGLAAFASATVVGVGVGVATPTVAHAAQCIDQLNPPYSGGGGRWANAARKGYIALHHSGGPGQNDDPCPYAAPYSNCATTSLNKYDFAVNGNGKIAVGGRYTNPRGCHAPPCNCQATGIVMLGCFGGCSTTNTLTEAQKCGVGYIWNQTGIERRADKLKPHQYCEREDPCNAGGGGTDCPGRTFTQGGTAANDYWNSAGLTLRSQILSYANRGSC